MAASRFESQQYFSEAFVESAGAVVFRLSTKQVCVIRMLANNEHLLPKGRRNLSETRQTAALREIVEETGYSCRILPVNIVTRNPPAVETESLPDEPRLHVSACEPFALQVRHLAEGDVKLIWWYIAAVNEDEAFKSELQERDKFAVEFYGYAEVVQRLTFQKDREMVQRAIDIVEKTFDS